MKSLNIQMVDLKTQYLKIKGEIDSAIQEVIESTQFIQGKTVGEFECKAAGYLGCKYTIGCASGTDALQIAMMALDIKPGDEIITSPFTFVATAETIALLGAKPVYVDIDEKTYNIDVNKIEEEITSKTKAIIPVHLYGLPCEMEKLTELANDFKLKIIEDSAQAFGTEYKGKKVGTIGDIGCISFFPSKNLGAFGDAGMLSTNNEELGVKIKMITVHGSKKKYHNEILGVNSRLDTIQAAILKVKLKYIEDYHKARIEAAKKYSQLLDDSIAKPYVPAHAKHIYHQYSIRVKNRDNLQQFLKDNNIPSMIYYPIPLHLQLPYKDGYRQGDFPVSELAAKEIISLPMHTELTEEQITYIADKVNEFVRKN